MKEVDVRPHDLSRFDGLIPAEQSAELAGVAASALAALGGRRVWNVNSTSSGGGVAELLEVLVSYARGTGIDARWLVIDGSPEFFTVTKRVHNRVHGSPGDGGELGEKEHAIYASVLDRNARQLGERVRAGDIVILHDPQTAGLAEAAKKMGAVTIWRSHIGANEHNEVVESGWDFLRAYIEVADAFVVTRREFAPSWMEQSRLHVILPSIDPFSPKNQDLHPDVVRSILVALGVFSDGRSHARPSFLRRDGSAGEISRPAEIVSEGHPFSFRSPVVTQVSRWDRLKDMEGVLRGFANHVEMSDARLVLAGPEVRGVADDPEAAQVLADCISTWEALPVAKRRRIALVSLPMEDVDANATAVNALQRHSAIVVQKSLVEGFALTVTEAMWKARAVVASSVGGIPAQIVDGQEGLLLMDPTDLHAFGRAVSTLLEHTGLAAHLGETGRRRATREFLGPRSLIDYGRMILSLLQAHPRPKVARRTG